MKLITLTAFVLSLTITCSVHAEDIKLTTSDDNTVFGSFHAAKKKNDAIVLLFHQARSNQHEYDPIYPLVNKAGFDTLTIDQRSGGTMWGKDNLTVKANGKSTNYASALPDLQAAVDWAVKKKYKKIIAVGSSYTAALNFVLAKQNKDHLTAIACFSPGEYLGKKWNVASEAKGLKLHVYVTTGGSIAESMRAHHILEHANLKNLTQPKRFSGGHGASVMHEKKNQHGYKECRKNFLKFLETVK